MTPRESPLRAEHEMLGARFVDFGGWNMPLSYPSGTVAEHLACRNSAVAFDVSHLGTVRLDSAAAFDALQAAFTNDLQRIAPGRAQYTHLLDASDGSVVDDCIIWWLEDGTFEVMPNASNTVAVRQAVGGKDVTGERAVIAVQGPQARELLAEIAPDAAEIAHFGVGRFEFEKATCVVAGTGYTGEDGVECSVPNRVAASFWRALLEAGVTPAGLGARDTLRLEAGLPLHGHELGPGISPLQAGLGWVVSWDKGPFRGREPLAAERERGPRRRLRGLLGETRRPPRALDPCLRDGQAVGAVSSGNFSPVLERGIAPAFLAPDIDLGDRVVVDVRGSELSTSVVKPPFQTLRERGAM